MQSFRHRLIMNLHFCDPFSWIFCCVNKLLRVCKTRLQLIALFSYMLDLYCQDLSVKGWVRGFFEHTSDKVPIAQHPFPSYYRGTGVLSSLDQWMRTNRQVILHFKNQAFILFMYVTVDKIGELSKLYFWGPSNRWNLVVFTNVSWNKSILLVHPTLQTNNQFNGTLNVCNQTRSKVYGGATNQIARC